MFPFPHSSDIRMFITKLHSRIQVILGAIAILEIGRTALIIHIQALETLGVAFLFN